LLLSRSEDLAKGWLLALLEDAPLAAAPTIVGADLSRDGPRVCQAVLRALVSDTDLEHLRPGGQLTSLVSRIGEMAGAHEPEEISLAVDALHAVVWAALSDELQGPDPALVAELAGRLALVTEHVRAAALRRGEAPAAREQADQAEPAPANREQADRPAPVQPAPQGADSPQAAAQERPRAPAPVPPAPTPAWPAETGRGETQALWMGALQEEIRRAGGAPLSLLLAELEDADRVTTVEPAAEASATFSEFAQAVRGVVRRQDILVSETDTRAWIIARDTGRAGARALGERLAQAVRERRPWRGADLVASVGVAVLGEDGRTASELIEAAEEAWFAGSAAGIGVVGAMPGEDPAD
jgi:GGDEF domain-containing protein